MERFEFICDLLVQGNIICKRLRNDIKILSNCKRIPLISV